MIKVENGVCEIKTSEGVPGMMTDLSIAVRSVKTTIVEKDELNEDQAKDLISHAVRLGLLTNEEVAKELKTYADEISELDAKMLKLRDKIEKM